MTDKILLKKENYAEAIEEVRRAIAEGKVVLYPTDTVYGIGCDATNELAVKRIYAIKGREGQKPLSVIMDGIAMIEYYCEVDDKQIITLKRYLPGPYTFILRLKRMIAASPTDRIGVRLPAHPFAREVVRKLGRPIVTTSANLSGQHEPTEFKMVNASIVNAVDLVVDGGPTKYAEPSTVIDLISKKVLRKGAGKYYKP